MEFEDGFDDLLLILFDIEGWRRYPHVELMTEAIVSCLYRFVSILRIME